MKESFRNGRDNNRKRPSFIGMIYQVVSNYLRTSIRSISFIFCLIPAAIHADSARPVSATDAFATAQR
jgi:hypothetical protein